MDATLEEVIESLKKKTDQKKGINCIPVPIGSYLNQEPAEMKFGRKETMKSQDIQEEQVSNRQSEIGTQRCDNSHIPGNALLDLDGDLIRVSLISS